MFQKLLVVLMAAVVGGLAWAVMAAPIDGFGGYWLIVAAFVAVLVLLALYDHLVKGQTRGQTLLVTIHWPYDADRSPETYGPFKTEQDRRRWVDGLEAGLVDPDARFLLHKAAAPFDPQTLLINGEPNRYN